MSNEHDDSPRDAVTRALAVAFPREVGLLTLAEKAGMTPIRTAGLLADLIEEGLVKLTESDSETADVHWYTLTADGGADAVDRGLDEPSD